MTDHNIILPPLFTTEPFQYSHKRRYTRTQNEPSMEERCKKIQTRLPSFKELSYMVESRQNKTVAPFELQTKNSNSSGTKSLHPLRQKQTRKTIQHHKKKPTQKQNKCHSCNSTETPEWRKGPLGPRTLCNACGLIWTKLCKQYDPAPEQDNSRDKHHLSFLLT